MPLSSLIKPPMAIQGAKGVTGLYNTVLGVSSKIYIESRGLINPPRLLALSMSTPSPSSPAVGFAMGQLGGLLGGSAMRPVDMIFPAISGMANSVALKQLGAVNPTTKYYIREIPYPRSIANKLLSGQQSVKGAIIENAAAGVRAAGAKIQQTLAGGGGFKDGIKGVKDGVKNFFKKSSPTGATAGYGDVFMKSNDIESAPSTGYYVAPVKSTTHFKGDPGSVRAISKPYGVLDKKLDPATSSGKGWKSKITILMDDIITGFAEADPGTTLVTSGDIDNKQHNLPYVLLQQYGKEDQYILLPGTISGLSESISPEWQGFRYVGSPFQTYRYGGVEREIKFNVKLYAESMESRKNMQDNLDKLRRLAFPDENISKIDYGSSILFGFNPNLWYLTVHGYYKKVLGIVSDVGIDIDDQVPWPMGEKNIGDVIDTEPYPVAVDVSIGLKVIENIPINGTVIQYKVGTESRLTGKSQE